jgi:hypothetical protein
VQFKNFQTGPIPVTVMHPVEISAVTGVRVSVFDCGVPITITLRNKSRIGLGLGAVYGRLVRVTLELQDAQQEHQYSTSDCGLGGSGLTSYSLRTQMTYDIDYLAPQSTLTLRGALSISPLTAKLYDHVRINYYLSLTELDRPLEPTSLDVIQQQSHSLQVAEYCQPISDMDCMLVVSNTSLEEVEYWREAFKMIGYTMCVFNVALYGGLS